MTNRTPLLLGSAVLAASIAVSVTTTRADDEIDSVVSLLEFVVDADENAARKCIGILTDKVQSGEVRASAGEQLQEQLGTLIKKIARDPKHPLSFDAMMLAASWGDDKAIADAKELLEDGRQTTEKRRRAVDALSVRAGPTLLDVTSKLVARPETHEQLRSYLVSALGRLKDPRVGAVLIDCYHQLDTELQPKAIEVLTQRPMWSKTLVAAMGRNEIPGAALNVNQVAKLLASRDRELAEIVREKWGTVRTERNPEREHVMREMRQFLAKTPGNPANGQLVFQKVCGQCHKIYGAGQEVGPDITRNGRSSFDQLLSNVFDPSLVIGAAYQARTVITADGRILTGLVAEDNEQRLVLKVQGGKQEIIPRDNIDEVMVSKLSLMPEGLEKQLKRVELADLFAFLTLDRPPNDPDSTLIPGTPLPE